MAAQDIKVESVRLDDIFIVGERRPTEDDAVWKLARSIAELGLRTPITLRLGDVTDEDGDILRSYILVAGGHRLAACRLLEWERIPAIVIDCDATDAEMWEIAENLHRADLSKAQRDEQIRRYAELLRQREEVSPQIDAKPQGGRPQGVASKVAEQTGLSKSTVERALNPDRVAEEKRKRDADAADRAEKTAEAKRQREAEQAENERQRQEAASGFSEAIKAREAAKNDAIAKRKAAGAEAADDGDLDDGDRVAELEEEVRALEAEVNRLKANLSEDEELERMRSEWRAGGWDKVIEKLNADHAFDVGVLKRQVERESADKVSFKRRGDFYERKAREYGWSNEEVIDLREGANG